MVSNCETEVIMIFHTYLPCNYVYLLYLTIYVYLSFIYIITITLIYKTKFQFFHFSFEKLLLLKKKKSVFQLIYITHFLLRVKFKLLVRK